MRVLVTGAAGFIGRRLCRRLKAERCAVRALDLAPCAGDWDEFVAAELGRGRLPPSAFAGIDAVIHLAGKVHALSEVKADDAEYARINTEGTREVLAAAQAARVGRFVFFSTVKAMTGQPQPHGAPALDETFPPAPDTPYGCSKLAAEKLVLEGGLVPDPVVLRLCLVYGPGVKGNIQKMIEAIRGNRFPPLPEVHNRRSMVHVDDVVQATLLAMRSAAASGRAYIVADGQDYSTRRMYVAICKALGKPVPAWTVPLAALRLAGWGGDALGRLRGRRFVFDSDALRKLIGSETFSSARIRTELGFQAVHTLESALPEMI
jgi:nucleoside-diphosphate-sugar epimerase